MAPAAMVAATTIRTMCERGSLRVSRAICWAVESKVMNKASVAVPLDELFAESPCEYAMGGRDFRMISREAVRPLAMRKRDPGGRPLTFP